MKFMHKALIAAAIAAVVAAPVIAGDMKKKEAKQNIVEIASSNPDFETLTAAIKAAGLAETLSGKGPFTVFAPTDAAFEKLPAGTLENLLKPENKDQLVSILTYHVVAGKVKAAEVVKLDTAATANGQNVDVSVIDGAVKVDNANVVATDIAATNGVIHVIDTVILPPAKTQ